MIVRKNYVAGRHLHHGTQEKLVLSPLPISAQLGPADTVGNIKEKNNMYLDIGGGGTNVQIEVAAVIINITFIGFLLVYLLIFYMDNFKFDWEFTGIFASIYCAGLSCIFYSIWSTHRDLKKNPFLRFNRQRREVAVPFGKKNRFITIPWEELYVWVETATVASDTMMASTSILMFTMPNPDNEEEFWSGFQLGAGGEATNCIMLWECIRHYMEEGPESCPESNHQDNLAEYIRSRKYFKEKVLTPWEYKKLKMADWFQWRYFAYWFEEWQAKQFVKKIPADIQTWSQPTPEDKWAKPSNSLITAEKAVQDFYKNGGKFGDKNMPTYQLK